MKHIRAAAAFGLAALLLFGCSTQPIINSAPEQEKIQIIGQIEQVTPTPAAEPTEEAVAVTQEPETPAPTEAPTEAPTPEPTEEPTPEPTDTPTPEPTDTPEPTETPTPDRTRAEEFCDAAIALIDLPYHRGGTSEETGFDPGGFVYYCLNKVGVKVRHKTSKGYSEMTEWQRVDSMDDLVIGDLCFFITPGNDAVNCVCIYLGDGKMIYPSSGEGKVITAKIGSNYWTEAFTFARRVF